MRRKWFWAVLFMASAAMAQTSADLSVAISADQTVDGNQPINFQVDVANNGPEVDAERFLPPALDHLRVQPRGNGKGGVASSIPRAAIASRSAGSHRAVVSASQA